MSRDNRLSGLKGSGVLFKPILTMVITLLLISLIAACAAPATTNQSPASGAPATSTIPPTTTMAVAAKPQGELIAALQGFGGENWLPWADASMANLHDLVYDMLIYWDHANKKFLPGLAESWENSPDGLTLTYQLRKGIQFSDGWGELTSADVKFNFEMQASPKSTGKVSQTRRIASMATPDPYTLIVHFKDPYPTFYVDLSMANSGVCQGIVSKKYYDTVGEHVASQKPIGTGPYRLVESQPGSYLKFEALDSNWRVVPEFKILTVRLIQEVSTYIAALKTKGIDLSQVPGEQLEDLKAAGVAVEEAPGGNLIIIGLGGMVVPEDRRYDSNIHNKDPWTDSRVRKAMAMAIDRAAIVKAIYNGYAKPVSVPMFGPDTDKYQYPYDPDAARQLLKDAGYPDGFSFRVISYVHTASMESPRIMEALAGYWQQIGLDPEITVIDYATYYAKNILTCKTAGDVFLSAIGQIADMLTKGELWLMPIGTQIAYEDTGSYTIWNNTPKSTFEERNALVDKLNQYYFDNVGPIPVVSNGNCWAWNSDKISPWPHYESAKPVYLEYVRHAKPLNTFRLFSPWPDR